MEGDVFYEACKDIPKDSELLVWYGDSYLQFMGVPVALKEMAGLNTQEEIDSKNIWVFRQAYSICLFCVIPFLLIAAFEY